VFEKLELMDNNIQNNRHDQNHPGLMTVSYPIETSSTYHFDFNFTAVVMKTNAGVM
jgi:hypothetical protein